MKWFLGTFTARFNRRHKVFGHLFSGRYKALIVDGSGDGYFRRVCDYVHLKSEFMGAEHYGAARRESWEEKAGRIIGEELRRLKWKEAELDSRPKGDTGKDSDCREAAGGNDRDFWLDCGPVAHGQPQPRAEPGLCLSEEAVIVSNSEN